MRNDAALLDFQHRAYAACNKYHRYVLAQPTESAHHTSLNPHDPADGIRL